MTYLKSRLPEEGSLVVCTIDRVEQHECFVKLDEFKELDGMVHTSEMDRKWIRNMRVFLKPGRQLVCKVMDVNPETKNINLSIRRVGEGQRRTKLQSWKNEKKADDLLQFFAKKNKLKIEDLYKKIDDNVIEEYGGLYPFMLEVTQFGENTLKELKIQSKLAHELFNLIKQRIKIPKAELNGYLYMHSTKGDGITVIRKAAEEIQTLANRKDYEIKLNYVGAPKYQLSILAENKKKAEQAVEEIIAKLQGLLGGKSNVEFKIK